MPKETVNFYAGNQLNRLSWMRSDSAFLNRTLVAPSTRFLVLQNLNPLVHRHGDREGHLALLGWNDVKDAVLESARSCGGGSGDQQEAVFGAEALGLFEPPGTDAEQKAFAKVTEGLVPHTLALVFLGVDERDTGTSSLPGKLVAARAAAQGADSDGFASSSSSSSETMAGTAYFGLSLTYRPAGTPTATELAVERLAKQLLQRGYEFVDTRSLAQLGVWEKHDAAVVAQARSMIDWAERYQYCPSCSRRQFSLWAGYKRACASSLGAAATPDSGFAAPLLRGAASFELDGKGPCASTRGLNNYMYPRTDSTIIAAITSPDGEKVLLGRQKRWPPGFVSCLAGFIEPGEAYEEAVRREIFEESGVVVDEVVFHSSQPWPFPANLMLGAIGRAAEGKDVVRLDLDNELEEAKWFSREEVLAALDASASWSLSKRDLAKIDENVAAQQEEAERQRQRQGQQQEQPEQQAGSGGGGAGGSGQASAPKWNERDQGSVANVLREVAPSSKRASFKLPGPTAIAHVLIAAWARGEVSFGGSGGGQRGRM